MENALRFLILSVIQLQSCITHPKGHFCCNKLYTAMNSNLVSHVSQLDLQMLNAMLDLQLCSIYLVLKVFLNCSDVAYG